MAREGSHLIGTTSNLLRDRSHGAINPAASSSIHDLGPRTVKENVNQEGTAYHRIKTAIKCCNFTKKWRNKLWFKVCTFILVLISDVADVFSDWSLFNDVVHVEPGLVFGPPEMSIIYALLFFSILGTATFSVEIVNVWLEIFHDDPLVDPELLSLLTIWIEDIPQITINIFIVLCHEDAISYYQIIKAVAIIFGGLIRVFMGCVRFGDRHEDDGKEKNKEKHGWKHFAYRGLIILGLLVLFLGSFAVCFLSLFERTPEGNIKFDMPKELFKGRYDRERYFSNVSIYLNLPILEYANTTENTTLNWIRLTSIFDIKDKNGDTFKLTYDNKTNTKFILWQSADEDRSKFKTKECFYFDREGETLSKGSDDCENFLENDVDTNSWIIHFTLVPEKIPELIFGDINYNTLFMEDNDCRNMTLQPVENIKERYDKEHQEHPVIHYFRSKDNATDTNHLVWDTPTNPRFFNQETDFIDITSVWKTGFGFCESTGSLAPHRNTSIHVDCH